MDKHHGLKRAWLKILLVIPLILGITSRGEGAGFPPAPEPPLGSVKVNGPRVGGTVTIIFVADVVRKLIDSDGDGVPDLNIIDKDETVGIVTSGVVASCKGEQFVLGPVIYGTGLSVTDFETQTGVAKLEDTDFGYVAPPGCFSTYGSEFLDIDTVVQYKVNSVYIYSYLTPEGVKEEYRAMVVADVVIGGYQ